MTDVRCRRASRLRRETDRPRTEPTDTDASPIATVDDECAGDRRVPDRRSELAARIPRLDAGEVIRLNGHRAPVRFLWPTDGRIDYPFAGVLDGTDGHRYPFYFAADDVAQLLRDEYVIVDADSVPVSPPPHAALDS